MLIDEKFEKEVPLSVDNNSAISTIEPSHAGPEASDNQGLLDKPRA
jgi:hypothetical protein